MSFITRFYIQARCNKCNFMKSCHTRDFGSDSLLCLPRVLSCYNATVSILLINIQFYHAILVHQKLVWGNASYFESLKCLKYFTSASGAPLTIVLERLCR